MATNPLSSDCNASMEVGRQTRTWRGFWMLLASAAALVIIGLLVRPTPSRDQAEAKPISTATSTGDYVQVTGPRQIAVKADTPLAKSLGIVTVSEESVAYPLLTVTGSVAARIRSGSEPLEERWQFASPDTASAYADWLKSKSDIEFNKGQLKSTRELTQAQIDRNKDVADHLRAIGVDGGIPGKELRAAEADLVQAKLQARKDVFAAETALRMAERQKSALERQLAQAGIEPAVFTRARDGMVLISANVPEARISSVKVNQACEVRFYAFPSVVYSAHVEELGSVLSTERRTMRVLFDLSDDQDRLKPGMFAEVGLGTDAREALVIPTNATLHIGSFDYVFKLASDGRHFEVTEVQIGVSRNDHVEVIHGLVAGDRIAGTEAVLLKPLAIQSLSEEVQATEKR